MRATGRWAWRLVAVLAGLGVLGFLVAASGVVPIKASSGHWAITKWMLHFGMRRSVATHALGIEAPPLLEDSALVLKGAGHYATACQPCHGAPGRPASPITRAATPPPPDLPQRIPDWEPAELFYIVKHGVKFTGMPAWPALEREDEIWAMVAFLRLLPELGPEQYRALADGNVQGDGGAPREAGLSDAAGSLLVGCARCHGFRGEGRGTGAFPRLAGQRPGYLAASLHAFAAGDRHSGIMEPVAAALEPAVVDELARYYAATEGGLTRSDRAPLPDPDVLRRGEALARTGVPERKVPACVPCHGPGSTPRNVRYPTLAGQYADYLVLQLRLFQQETRGGSAYAHIMHPAAAHLEAEERAAVAAWYASLTGDEEAPTDTVGR